MEAGKATRAGWVASSLAIEGGLGAATGDGGEGKKPGSGFATSSSSSKSTSRSGRGSKGAR